MQGHQRWAASMLAVSIGVVLLLTGCAGLPGWGQDRDSGPAAVRSDGAELIFAPDPAASAQNPAFSPDGQTLLFTLFHRGYNHGPAGLYLLPLRPDGQQPEPLIDEADQDSVNLPGSCWNAATDRITFASDRQDVDEVWTTVPAGSDLSRVTQHSPPTQFTEPSFSPGGQWIVFEAAAAPGGQRRGSIWRVRATRSELTQLTGLLGADHDDRQPNWSPAGDRIVFQRRAPGSDDWNLYTMTPQGTDLRAVTTSPASDTDASWSPDGRWIVFSSDYGDLARPNLYLIPAQGGEPVRLTHDESREDSAPSWSPDGRWIAFESHEGDEDRPSSLWRIAVPSLSPPTPPDAAGATEGWWQPPPRTSWQWQLGGLSLDPSPEVEMFDIDLFDTDAATVAALQAQGRKVTCYISVGSWENWRPDADQFPASVIGNDYKGWPGEKWLDIRQIDVLAPLMHARLDLCRAKGFDGVEPDNIDIYPEDTGFELTYKDGLPTTAGWRRRPTPGACPSA